MSDPPKPARAVYSVRGASCVTCALAIEKQVAALDGVETVRSSIMLNQVFVDYDPTKLGPEKIAEAIKRTGYSNNLVRKD
ncbi:MAG: heavy-metal-associated domain-containing protein [Nitrososphaerota archaeon]|nr:heavy-metal-associated domain-containing protein [Nitrososphaerota archaeon]